MGLGRSVAACSHGGCTVSTRRCAPREARVSCDQRLRRVDLLARRRTTDSFGPQLRPIGDGLGLLPWSNGVHYDSEEQRRPLFQSLIADGTLPAGCATDDGAGFSTAAPRWSGLRRRDGAGAYFVERGPTAPPSRPNSGHPPALGWRRPGCWRSAAGKKLRARPASRPAPDLVVGAGSL